MTGGLLLTSRVYGDDGLMVACLRKDATSLLDSWLFSPSGRDTAGSDAVTTVVNGATQVDQTMMYTLMKYH